VPDDPPEAAVPPEEAPVEVVEVVVVPVVVVPVADGVETAPPLVGTVSCGAPEVSVELPLPPPHAATPVASEPPARKAAISEVVLRRVTSVALGAEGFHAPAAVRAVVEVLLCELVAPVAKPKVLDRPWEF
jgi:hypothetical protein